MTQNKETYRFKGRAIFLAAIMVISVLAMPIAFAGGAAADADTTSSLEFNNQAIVDGEVTVEDVSPENAGEDFTDSAFLVITTPQDDDRTIVGAENLEGISDGDDVDVELVGATPGEHEAHIIANSELQALIDDDDNEINEVADFFGVDAEDFVGDEINPHGTDSALIGAASNDADVTFATAADLVDQAVWQGQEIAVGGFDADENVQLRERIDSESSSLRAERTANAQGVVEFRTANRAEGQYFLNPSSMSLENTFDVIEQDLDVDVDDETVTDEGPDATTDIEFESNRGTYDVNVSADGLDEEDLSSIFEDVGDNVVEDDDDGLITIEGVSNDEYELNFTDIDTGDYEFEFEVTDTTASASASVTVEEAGDAEANFAEGTFETTQGDWAEITVEFEGTSDDGLVVIGDLDDDGYQLNVTIDDIGDDDEVTLYLNTYTAGTFGEDVDEQLIRVSEDSDDADASIDYDATEEHPDADLDGEILDTGSYELVAIGDANVDFADKLDEADDIATLLIEERGESSMNLWTASSSNADDVEDLEDLVEAIENEQVTETDTVAADDVLIHEIGADGLSGLIGQNGDYDHDDVDVTDAFVDSIVPDDRDFPDGNTVENFSLALEQQNPTSNRAAKELDLESQDTLDALTVLFDKDSNTYYAILDISSAEFTRDLADEDEFEAQLNVKDSKLLDEDTDDFSSARDYEDNAWESAIQDFEFLDRDADFDLSLVDGDNYVTVEDAEDQEVSGTTNIAPGSEVTIRLRGTEGSSFVKSQTDVVVTADGTFAADFDFSDRSVGDEFSARLRSGGDALDDEDGLVVEAVDDLDEADDDEADDADDEADDHDDMDDDVDADDEDDTVEETEDDTPGFGALVAFLAVLGAAFLATRRQN